MLVIFITVAHGPIGLLRNKIILTIFVLNFRKYFCGGNHAVLNGNTIELTRLTANPHDCRHIPAATYQ